MASEPNSEQILAAVRERYATAAKRVLVRQDASCCASSSGRGISSDIYDLSVLREVPTEAAMASLGCGNPLLLAELKPGEVVLDLGSGGGIDVLLSAKRVGPTGKAYGLDMTDEMLELARANARAAGAGNVEFLKGQIESIPLPDASVDVIISNCVINLSADKDAVLAEAYRVLKPGGRFAVADIVVQGGPLPPAVRQLMALWAGCVAGALGDEEYRQKLAAAGFATVDLQVLKEYGIDDVPDEVRCCVPADLGLAPGTRVVSAFVKAVKAPAERQASEPGPAGTCAATTCGCGIAPDTVRAYFDRIADEWDQLREGYFGEGVRQEVLRRVNPNPRMRVADIGCGTAFLSEALAPHVAEVNCVDASPGMLEQARRHLAAHENVRYHLADGTSIPLADGSVDAVVANMYLHHAPDPARALGEMVRILAPGGRLVLTDLDEHEEEWQRVEMADVWLGFPRATVREWLAEVGLQEVAVESCWQSCCADKPAGGRAAISIFVASGRKPR